MEVANKESSNEVDIDLKKHLKFLNYMLNVLPSPYAGQDCNRLTLLYFIVAAIDLLGGLDKVDKKRIIDYVYSQQVLPDKSNPELHVENCGFRGGPFFGNKYNPNCEPTNMYVHDKSHIAMTYTALAILAICGDNFEKVEKKAIVNSLKKLQKKDGSFECSTGCENDMRFVYCAAVISYMLDDFSGIDEEKAVNYILSSQSYDAAIGQGPGQESHGGSTYCAVAALELMGKLDRLPRKQQLIQWCIERQVSGFQGRINKPPDSCYSFWIGTTLKMLGASDLVEYPIVKGFISSCEYKTGGFGKVPETYPDVLHTYMSFCGMSLGGEKGIKQIDPALGFNKEVADNIRRRIGKLK